MAEASLKPKKPLPKGMIPIRDSAVASKLVAKSTEARWATRAAGEVFKINARAFLQTMNDLPEISPLDVVRLAVHTALGQEDFESAAKYANMLAEYELPKLARIESNVTTRVQDLSDDELKEIISKEKLG